MHAKETLPLSLSCDVLISVPLNTTLKFVSSQTLSVPKWKQHAILKAKNATVTVEYMY